MIEAPPALTLALLPDSPGEAHVAARAFCLDAIKEFYDFDYRPDWHADLDSLLLPAPQNHYSASNRGAFCDADGSLVATAGIRRLGWKPQLVTAFAERCPEPEAVSSLWRVYVRADQRGCGGAASGPDRRKSP